MKLTDSINEWSDCKQLLPTLWRALTTDPATGVVVLDADLDVKYINNKAAQLFAGPDAAAPDYLGRRIDTFSDPRYSEQRKELSRQVLEQDQPLLLRTIWRGKQVLTWYSPLIPNDQADRGEGLVMWIIRVTPGIGIAKTLTASQNIPLVESEIADLGPLQILTRRELEILALLGQHHTIKQIAEQLHRSIKTIENHRLAIGRKLNLNDRAQLIQLAHDAGLSLTDAQHASEEPPQNE